MRKGGEKEGRKDNCWEIILKVAPVLALVAVTLPAYLKHLKQPVIKVEIEIGDIITAPSGEMVNYVYLPTPSDSCLKTDTIQAKNEVGGILKIKHIFRENLLLVEYYPKKGVTGWMTLLITSEEFSRIKKRGSAAP